MFFSKKYSFILSPWPFTHKHSILWFLRMGRKCFFRQRSSSTTTKTSTTTSTTTKPFSVNTKTTFQTWLVWMEPFMRWERLRWWLWSSQNNMTESFDFFSLIWRRHTHYTKSLSESVFGWRRPSRWRRRQRRRQSRSCFHIVRGPIPWSSLVAGDEGSYLPNGQSNSCTGSYVLTRQLTIGQIRAFISH